MKLITLSWQIYRCFSYMNVTKHDVLGFFVLGSIYSYCFENCRHLLFDEPLISYIFTGLMKFESSISCTLDIYVTQKTTSSYIITHSLLLYISYCITKSIVLFCRAKPKGNICLLLIQVNMLHPCLARSVYIYRCSRLCV